MNQKLIALFKKIVAFMKSNWIAVAIIVGLLIFGGGMKSCANKKIAKLDAENTQLKKDNKQLDQQVKDREKENKVLDAQLKVVLKDLSDLQKEKENIAADKVKIAKKYADLMKKYGELSQAQKDALLVEVLKKNNISVEIRDNSLIITLEERGKLYTLIVSIDQLNEQLVNCEAGKYNCEMTVVKKDEEIKILGNKLVLKDKDIGDLNIKITNLDKEVKNLNKKIFWSKVGFLGKTAVPALVIGLLVGHFVK